VLADLSLAEFLEQTASKAPVPGGGSVAALNGGIAAGLVEMVARLTIGRKGFEAVSGRMGELAATAGSYRRRMLHNVDRDSEAFAQVLQAFRMPRGTGAQQREREAAIQEAYKAAARIPLEVAEDALQLIDLATEVVAGGNPNAVSDGAVGVLTARTAVLGAVFNVRINLQSIRDVEWVAALRGRADALEAGALDKERRFLAALKL
jgi:formiminotetrahydrofolate cyclodeaminase